MDANGDMIGADVSLAAEASAFADDARMRAIIDSSLDCIVTMDEDGRITEFNRAAERCFGLDCRDVIGRELAEVIVPPALRAAHRAGLRRFLDGGEARVLDRRLETLAMRADGSEFPVELTITQVSVPGELPSFTGHLRDITDRKRAETELRASRARLVEATDVARRRLERDLHDGAQQRLVGLALDLQLARETLQDDPDAAAALLEEAIGDLRAAIDELRELARGIHPAVLTSHGLSAALPELVRRSPIPVVLTNENFSDRLPHPVEASIYFLVAEALTNAAKYSGATKVEVELSRTFAKAVVEVRDDGSGGASLSDGSGLQGLADRVGAIGGRFDVTSPAGGGTRIRAELPCG